MAKKWLPDLQWHKESLSSMCGHLAMQERQLAERQANVDRLREEVKFYQRQIDEAGLAGKPAFDRDRYLKSKRVHYVLC